MTETTADDDDDNEHDEITNSIIGDDPNMMAIHKQVQLATQQLHSFQSVLHSRLLRARHWLEYCQVFPENTAGATTDNNNIHDAIVASGISMTDFMTDLDHAIERTITIQQWESNNEINDENQLILVADSPSISGIQMAIEESHWIPNVEAALAEGRVKPIFHALSLPQTFLNNRRSLAKVTLGEVDSERTLELEFDDDHGGKHHCWEDVIMVDHNSSAGGMAPNVILDRVGMERPSKWYHDKKIAAFAVELVNTEAEMLGEGIECTQLSSSIPLSSIYAWGDAKNIILTRPESRGAVSDIFHQFAKEVTRGSVAAITGVEGIGKSWTLVYALQQALLYDGATVLFFFPQSGRAKLFLRKNNKMYAWTACHQKDAADSSLFNRSDVLILLDPKEADDGGATFSFKKNMKLVYAAYNHENYFMGGVEKEFGNIQVFLGPPLDRELFVIMARFCPELSQDEIETRMAIVGNLIRYVLRDEQYQRRMYSLENAIYNCSGDDNQALQQALRDKGMSNSSSTISGRLFEVLPVRPKRLADIGYDGQNVEYRKLACRAVNQKVRTLIGKAGREMMLLYWDKVSDEEKSILGRTWWQTSSA